MGGGSDHPLLLDTNRSESTGGDCCCRCSSVAAQPISPPAMNYAFPHSRSGTILAMFGLLGWLSIPKCPLCLATYMAMGSGMTLSFAESQGLRQLWLITVTAMMLLGIWRLASYGRQSVRLRLTSQTPHLDLSVRDPD